MKTRPWPLGREVHLYGLSLPRCPAELTLLKSFLAPDEMERAGLLKNREAFERRLAGRGLLREILGGYLGTEARNVRLATGEHGKPCLADRQKGLHFNLAHSGDALLLAVAAGREVGVDIETIDPDRPLVDMSRMVFSRHEQEQLSGLSSPYLEDAFYRCWVRKEACLKACGRGFSLSGNTFDVSPLDKDAGAGSVRCDGKTWQVLDIDVPPGYCAALAVESCDPAQPSPLVTRVDHCLSFSR